MTRTLIIGVLLAALASLSLDAQEPARLLRSAMNVEMVDGDLKGAIALYEKVVAAGDRALAAQALVRMAECYQKLGDAEARRIYERIVKEYTDQPDAVAAARARLGADESARRDGPSLRRVYARVRDATVLPDGRRISYNANQDLGLVDPDGAERVLTQGDPAKDEHSAGWRVSVDGTQLAYTWFTDDTNRYDLRVLSLRVAGTGPPVSRRVLWALPIVSGKAGRGARDDLPRPG